MLGNTVSTTKLSRRGVVVLEPAAPAGPARFDHASYRL